MPFHSGRVTFCRFRVEGDAPAAVDETTLGILAEFSFREREVGASDEIEAGWTTGEHLLDTQFSYEKNGYGDDGSLLLFALRIDSHRVPSAIKNAYKRMNEAALAAENPSGIVSRAQRREAAETANQQIHEELAAGKHRRSKSVPLIWDLARRELYCSVPSGKVIELLASQFYQSFNCKLSLLSAGALAGEWLRASGKGRDYEDFHPSEFTPAPAEAVIDLENADGPRDLKFPQVPWSHTSTDLKDFLGNEFLIWLWWKLENSEGLIELPAHEKRVRSELAVMIDKSLDMDCAWNVLGKQTLRATGPTKLAEAGDALLTGKWPRKAGLLVADTGGDGLQWELSLQADRWIISGATIPENPDATTPREIIEHRLVLIRRLAETMDGLFGVFIKSRVSSTWPGQKKQIRDWIRVRRSPARRAEMAAAGPS
ncbi:MAG: hypothetical protein IT444_11070 [Phycisphaeraceae bacterium]|nr:hypothetical protein [Phycisphaeraceae bacterium]